MFFYVTLLNMVEFAQKRLDRENGATAVEYGLMVAVLAIGIIVGITLLKDKLNTLFSTVGTKLTTS